VGIFLVLVLLAAGGIATRYFVLSQYYVGEGTDSEVAVFRGVPGSVLGIQLHQQAEGSCPIGSSLCDKLLVTQLQQDAQTAVRNGVKKDSLQAGRDYINFLRTKIIRDCPAPATGQPVSSTPPPPSSPPSGASSAAATSPASSPAPSSATASDQAGRDCPLSNLPGGGGG
jgi:protein phosphatase